MQRPDPLVVQTKKVVAAVEGTSSEKGRVDPEVCEEREVPATVQPAPLLSLDARTGQSQSKERIVVGESPIADPGEDGVGTPADKERFMTDKERFMALTLPEVDPESVQQTTDESEGDKVEFSQVGQTSYFEVPLTSSEIGQEGARADGGTCDIVESPVQDKGGMQPLHATEELAPSGARLGLSHVAPPSSGQVVDREVAASIPCMTHMEPVTTAPAINGETSGTDQVARIKAFCASVIKTLAPPLLREVESSVKLRATAEPFTPRRVTRRSNLGAEASGAVKVKKASAAESVLLKALGIVPAELAVNEEDVQLFRQMFDSPIREQQLRVVAAIFGKTLPRNLMDMERAPGPITAM
jgi:hypothetical protein